jgi:hypothetical protein
VEKDNTMSTSNGNGHTIAFRVGELEKDVRELQGISRGLPERIEQLERSQEKLADSLGRMTMAIVGFTLTVAGSSIAVLFALGA